MMPIAIQEDLLTGSTILEKFHHAQALGIDGIEFWGSGLTEKIPEIVAAIEATGIQASSVNHGHQGSLLDPDLAERERELVRLRQSIVNAVDIGADGVAFVPHFNGPVLPDLSPWMSAAEVEAEMLYTHLRTLEDYSEALGVDLYIEAINRHETHLLNRLEQAARVTRRMNHVRVQVAANLFHMALEESDLASAIRAHADCIGHIHVADNNRLLPGEGSSDFAAVSAALREIGYHGWLVYECGTPGSNDPAQFRDRLPASLAYLKQIGLT